MVLGLRVLSREMPLSKQSRKRLLLAMMFNTIGFYFWLTFGFKMLRHLF
jgi:hypothetical protein